MKDYYEILEVNETASKETIERVYKLLVKKYHPDLQPPESKKSGEEKIKQLSEAYEILSDDVKKIEYDIKLKEYKIEKMMEDIKSQSIPETEESVETISVVDNTNQPQSPFSVTDDEIRRQAQLYYDEVYKQYLYRNGYIKDYPALFKHYITVGLTIASLSLILFLLYQIPFFNQIFWDFVNSNPVLKEMLRILFNMTN